MPSGLQIKSSMLQILSGSFQNSGLPVLALCNIVISSPSYEIYNVNTDSDVQERLISEMGL